MKMKMGARLLNRDPRGLTQNREEEKERTQHQHTPGPERANPEKAREKKRGGRRKRTKTSRGGGRTEAPESLLVELLAAATGQSPFLQKPSINILFPFCSFSFSRATWKAIGMSFSCRYGPLWFLVRLKQLCTKFVKIRSAVTCPFGPTMVPSREKCTTLYFTWN